MRVMLINPPLFNMITTTLPDFAVEDQGILPPLGLLYLAAILEGEKDYQVTVLDSQLDSLTYEEIGEKITEFGPNLVGISAWSFSYLDTLLVAKMAKEASKKIAVCIGGPHVTIYPRESLLQKEIDFVILGEGEKPFFYLLKALSGKGKLSSVPNLGYKENGKLKFNPTIHREEKLDDIPFPAREKVDYRRYYSILTSQKPVTSMITSRGCPYQCIFCYQRGTGWKARSAPNIVDEMQKCKELGIKEIFIFDETFTVSKKRVLEICREISRRNLNMRWHIRARVDTVGEELLYAMKQAGCWRISFGIESGEREILKILNKNISLDKVKRTLALARKFGFETLTDFMIGSPNEDRKNIETSFKLALKLKPDFVQFSVTTALPATELYDKALKEKVIQEDIWRNYALKPTADFQPPIWNHFSRKEIMEILTDCYRRFYLRPTYILYRLLKVRSLRELKRNILAALKMLNVKKKLRSFSWRPTRVS